MEGLIKNYPYVIRYQNTTGKNTFYIKVTGLTYGIILFSTTKNNDAPYVITARSASSPSIGINIANLYGSFNGIKPCKREEDSALYFECDGGGVSGRYFDVYIYNKLKEDISYSIEDHVDGLIYLD